MKRKFLSYSEIQTLLAQQSGTHEHLLTPLSYQLTLYQDSLKWENKKDNRNVKL